MSNVFGRDRDEVEKRAKKFAQYAISSQYTPTGKPKPDRHDIEATNIGFFGAISGKVRGQAGKDLKSLHDGINIVFDKGQEIEAVNWESTKALYALGRKNFIKTSIKITALAVTSTVIGVAGLIVGIKAYRK